jgi:hypothetical protein
MPLGRNGRVTGKKAQMRGNYRIRVSGSGQIFPFTDSPGKIVPARWELFSLWEKCCREEAEIGSSPFKPLERIVKRNQAACEKKGSVFAPHR